MLRRRPVGTAQPCLQPELETARKVGFGVVVDDGAWRATGVVGKRDVRQVAAVCRHLAFGPACEQEWCDSLGSR